MMQHYREFCTSMVREMHGELASHVFSSLMVMGRARIGQIVHQSNVPARQVKHGLFILIQLRLAVSSLSEQDGLYSYEPCPSNAYALIRGGKIIQHINERFDEASVACLLNLIALGHANVDDILQASDPVLNRNFLTTTASQFNGDIYKLRLDKADSNDMKGQRRKALKILIRNGYVVRLSQRDFRPDEDVNRDAEREVRKQHFPSGLKGQKDQTHFRREVRRLRRSWRDQGVNFEGVEQINSPMKRTRMTNDSTSQQRRKLINNTFHINTSESNSDSEEVTPFDTYGNLGVNYEKWSVVLRNRQLVQFASRFLGEEISLVYRVLLNLMEDKILRCTDVLQATEDDEWDEDHFQTFTTLEIMDALRPYSNNEQNGEPPKCHDPSAYDHSDLEQILSSTDKSHLGIIHGDRQLLNEHLGSLSEDPRRFVTKVGAKGGGEWKVEFNNLSRILIQLEIEIYVTACFGSVASRIVRILYDKGKLDEKKIGDFALLRPRDLRSALTALQAAGIVDVQSVPRDASRQTSKTIFLWSFEQDQCRRLMLINTYKAMSRLMQRASSEQKKYQSVLEKAERTDVVGNEAQYLSAAENLALDMWNNTEKGLLTQLWRLDDLVSILRDF